MVAAGFTGGQAEELRRAIGFKRSERRMKQIEVQLRDGMARQRHHRRGGRADHRLDPSFALYGFPESHAASFALLAYASAYLKVHYPGGVLHGAPQQPADGVLSSVDAGQGRAAPRRPISADRRAALRLGLHGRTGRRDSAGAALRQRPARRRSGSEIGAGWPGCRQVADQRARRSQGDCAVRSAACDDPSMLECGCDQTRCPKPGARSLSPTPASATTARTTGSRPSIGRARFRVARRARSRGPVCAATRSSRSPTSARSTRSATTGARALWQAERAVRPSGELFDEGADVGRQPAAPKPAEADESTSWPDERRRRV